MSNIYVKINLCRAIKIKTGKTTEVSSIFVFWYT